jgi:hypothetical protein
MGYSLYRKGVLEITSDVKACWGDKHILLKRVAPGAFLAVCGVLIALLGIARPLVIEHTTISTMPGTSVAPTSVSEGPASATRKTRRTAHRKANTSKDSPLVNTQDASQGHTFESTKIAYLPSEGRDPVAILSIMPKDDAATAENGIEKAKAKKR